MATKIISFEVGLGTTLGVADWQAASSATKTSNKLIVDFILEVLFPGVSALREKPRGYAGPALSAGATFQNTHCHSGTATD